MTIPRRYAGYIWAANRVSVTVCYFRFKTDRLLVTPESTESFSRVSLSKCGRLFPVFIQIRPKISGAQYLSDSRPGCDKRVQCPALGTLYWQLGCGEQLWPYIGWWWPGGWPLTNIYNIVKISVTAPQTTTATSQPTIFTAARSSWNAPQSSVDSNTLDTLFLIPLILACILYCNNTWIIILNNKQRRDETKDTGLACLDPHFQFKPNQRKYSNYSIRIHWKRSYNFWFQIKEKFNKHISYCVKWFVTCGCYKTQVVNREKREQDKRRKDRRWRSRSGFAATR